VATGTRAVASGWSAFKSESPVAGTRGVRHPAATYRE
jgi:hypothetical protein